MREIPKTRYAMTSDGVHIAYQVSGRGPIDLLWAGCSKTGEPRIVRSSTGSAAAPAARPPVKTPAAASSHPPGQP